MEENLNPTVETTGEEDLMDAIRQFKEMEESGEFTDELSDDEQETDTDSNDSVDENDEDDQDDEDVETDSEDDSDVEEEPKKKTQSKEENARFAAERRQRELDKRVQEELDRIKMSSPEYQLAEMLAKQYGTTPDVIVKQLQEQELQKQAEQQGVPIEHLRETQELKETTKRQQDQINQLLFQQWRSQIQVESTTLLSKPEFSMLSQEDMDAAANHMLTKLKANDVPLEDVVYMLHGRKIIEGHKQKTEQEILAKESGRSKKPLAPNNRKPSETQTLTDEERYVARQMGLSDDDYLKYK